MAIGAAAWLTALVIACNVPGNLIGGWLLHRHLARWKLLVVSGFGMIACLAVIFAAQLPDTPRYLACLLFSLFGGMLPAAVLSGAPVVAPSGAQVATTNGLLIQGSNVGQMIGPPALAWLVTLTADWQSGAWMLQGAALGVVALAFAYRSVERRLLPASA
jgi:MFS family permease